MELNPETYAINTLQRYTGSKVTDFGKYILLVNFHRYIENFAQMTGAKIHSGHWTSAHDPKQDTSIINFGVGSPSAGIVMHCISYIKDLKAVLMLGMCGGIDDRLSIGDLLIPTASVRDEGTSRHYIPKDVPAQPSLRINRVCEEVIHKKYGTFPKSGIMMTTDYRMWEFDKKFIKYILRHHIIAIDMEIATLFAVAYARQVSTGSLMLVSDMPLQQGGIKSEKSAREVFKSHTDRHMEAGTAVIRELRSQPG